MKPLRSQALERVGKNWKKSKGTREAKLQTIKRFTNFIEKKYGLERIEHLKPGHVKAFAEHLHEQKIDARTGANYMAHIRDLCQAIGKKGIVSKDNAAYGFGGVSRMNPMKVNISKIGEIQIKLESMAAASNRTAMMMTASFAMREAFGLRQKEALLSNKISIANGKTVLEVEGAKGGRLRQIEIVNEKQLNALDKVALTARLLENANGRIIPPERSLEQALRTESRLWSKLGGTREAKANMHSQRHSYAQTRKNDGATKAELNNDLGHGEHRSLGHYTE